VPLFSGRDAEDLEPSWEETMQQEILSWVRVIAAAGGALLLIGLIVALGGPALELIGG